MSFVAPSQEDLNKDPFALIPEGSYHVIVEGVNSNPTSADGSYLDAVQVDFNILAGTVQGQAGSKLSQTFFLPSAKAKNGGAFQARMLTKLALAGDLIGAADLGGPIDPPWDDLLGQQMVIAVSHRKSTSKKDGKEYTNHQVDGAKIWHIHDPDVTAVPKDKQMLAELDGNSQPPQAQQAEQPQQSRRRETRPQEDRYAGL